MAPKSKDPDWLPSSTLEQKACGNRPTRRKSDTPTGKEDAEGKGKPSVGMRTKVWISEPSKAKASLHVHQPPPKKRRGMQKRRPFNKLVGLITTVVPGCLNLSWMKKKRSNTPIRRRNMSTFAALVRVHYQTVQNKDLEKDIIIDKDSAVDAGIEEIISLGDSPHKKGDGDILEFQPPLKVYKRCKDRSSSFTITETQAPSIEENSPMIPETQVMVDETRDMEESSPMILDTQVMVGETRYRSLEEDCDDGMNSSVIPETQMVDELTTINSSSFTILMTGKCNNVDLFESEANVMLPELKENMVPLTPQIQEEKGKLGNSSNQDCFIPSVSAPSKSGQVESLIDILKKRNGNGVDNTPNKKKKKKRHNPKVVNPSTSTPNLQTPKHAERLKKKMDPSTSKLAKQVKKKVDSLEDENGVARWKRKRVSRKLNFDGEAQEHELNFDGEAQEHKLNFDGEAQDRLSDLKSQQIRKKRSKRKRISVVRLNNLITSMSSAYIQFDRKGLRMKRVINAYFGAPKRRQDNVLLIQDEPFFKAVEDFLIKKMESLTMVDDNGSKKMESLTIVDDSVSNQLVVQEKSGVVALSGKKKIRKKGPKPDVRLDEGTMKVWDLLMTSNWSEAAEAEALENNEDEYMKGERKLFRERLERLISRMNVVHGSREFKPWRGSVMDSIVGVFLTQNVGDNFSSSAFMTLRARYPPLSLSEQNTIYCREDEQVMMIEHSNNTNEEHPTIQVPVEPSKTKTIQVPVEPSKTTTRGEHNPKIQVSVEPSKTTTRGEHNPKIQVEIDNEFDGESPKANKGSKKGNKKRNGKKKEKEVVDWDLLRKQYSQGNSKKRTEHNADSVNWEAIRQASEAELALVIHKRGMNNQLARRIKRFLDRMVKDHGSLDLEWLRHVPPLKAKDFLMSIKGLALKSTECVRLLALHFPAFPVDTNAGRFFVRVGWVPLKPLPEDVQLHLLNKYPVLDSIQKYIWPRVCDNGHPLLYEAHCHSITIAKSFCTMTKPNCNECPMRDECNHFASAHASAKLRLEGPKPENVGNPSTMSVQEAPMVTNVDGDESRDQHTSRNSEPIIEFPPSPVAEPVPMEPLDGDIEDIGCDSEIIVPMEPLDGDIEDIGRDFEITTIRLNGREFSKNLHSFVNEDDEVLKALVPLDPRLGSVPIPKHKVAIGLRTVHQVYELPDSHPLLHTFDKREPDDPCPYFLAIWTANEKESTPCDAGSMCSSGEVAHYQKHGAVKGTILIPCLTANKGVFPLNGTYFQPHEVFADHESSRQPIDVPRYLIWNLNRRFLYCGTSVASICKGMTIQEVAYSFRRSVICVREFDRKTGFPRTLANRFHLCKSRPVEKM